MQNDEQESTKARLTSRSLAESIWFNSPVSSAAAVDFGIDSEAKYQAIHDAVRRGDIMNADLHAVLGDGEKITALVNSIPGCNPHGLVFHTFWDDLYGRGVHPEEPREMPQVKRREKQRQRDKEIER